MSDTFDQWAILELMGHVRLAGRITEEEHFGAKLGRIDIPNSDGFTTQYFTGGAIYRLTPTTEDIARGVAQRNQPEPVHRWELPRPQQASDLGGPGGIDIYAAAFESDDEDEDEDDEPEEERYSAFGYSGPQDDD